MRRVLVTGASGLIGRHVVRQMAGAFAPICVGRQRRAETDAEYIAADLTDPRFVERLPSRIDAVIHLAQSERYAAFPRGASSIFQINTASTAQLLEWAHAAGAAHFVQASTGGIYGAAPRALKETDAVRIRDVGGRLAYYYATKYAAEIVASAYRERLTVVLLRYFFVYGADQNPLMLIPRLIDAVGAGRPLAIAGESGMRLNPIYCEDAATATVAALDLRESKTINVAGAEVVSMRELGQIIAAAMGKPALFEKVEQVPAAGANDLVADISLMVASLGAPRISIREGVARVCHATSKV